MIAKKELEQEVRKMVEAIISEDSSLFIVDIALKGNPGNQRLMVWLDGDKGVTIDQCSKVSRKVGHELEERELIDDKYHLEVSSAGVDYPLQMERQYKKNVGRSLRVTLKNDSKVEGLLKDVNGSAITLEEQKKKEIVRHEIKFEEIDKSIVLVSFK